jgi:hypothetical protein
VRVLPVAAATAIVLLTTGVDIAAAQSSMFGVRGLGFPGRPQTAQSRGTGSGLALFDPESDVNPAALTASPAVTGGFVLVPDWRHWDTPAGSRSLRETRFPLMYVVGPIPRTPLAVGVSIGSYSDRDFKLASVGVDTLRGVPLEVFDTLTSIGGLNEIRLATGDRLGGRTSIGAGVHLITGSSRIDTRRAFGDTTYLPIRQKAELTYSGLGFSVGITHQVSNAVTLAAMVRADTRARVDLDSARAFNVDLPYTFSAGAALRPSNALRLGFSGTYRTWSGANSDLLAQGSPGAQNTMELAAGGEWYRNRRRPLNLPLRFGVRYAQIPFPVEEGAKPREFSLSLGTGLRFAQDRAGVDVGLEHAWRSESSRYKERALALVIGLTLRPYGTSR